MNGEIILYSEVRERVFQMNASNISNVREDGKTEKNALQSLLDEKLIVQFAKEKEMKVSEREVDSILKSTMARMELDEKEFDTLLKSEGLTIGRYRGVLENQIMARNVMSQEVRRQVKLSEEDVRDYYDEHLQEFTTESAIRVRHILLLINEETEENLVLSKISFIRDEILSGLDFVEAARRYSEGPSASGGGDLGEVKPGNMVEEFEDVAFSLEPGTVSKPIRTKFGYHLIKVDSKSGGDIVPLEKVRLEIENRIFQQLIIETREEWLGRVKKEAFIDIKMSLN